MRYAPSRYGSHCVTHVSEPSIIPPFFNEKPVVLILDAPGERGAIEVETMHVAGLRPEVIMADGVKDDVCISKFEYEEALQRADVILTWRTPITHSMLTQASRCLMVQRYGPGYGDGAAAIANETARVLGIYLASSPDYASSLWAEAAMTILKHLSKTVPFSKAVPSRALKRVGLVGLGHVGQSFTRLLQSFGMEVWAYDPFIGDEIFAQLSVRRVELEVVFALCDVVSLHLPINISTCSLIDTACFELMKPGSLLINVSDAATVNLNALLKGFERGRPCAAGFNQPVSVSHPALMPLNLVGLDQEYLYANECAQQCRQRIAECLIHFFRGLRPNHLLIDPPCPRHILALVASNPKEAVW